MKNLHQIIVTVIIVFVCLGTILPITGAEKPATKPAPKAETAIAPAKPETWDTAIAKVKKDQDALAEVLIAVANDEKRSDEDRRKAIYGLGEIRNKQSLAFLMNNVSLRILMDRMRGAEDFVKLTPCQYMLRKGDWNTAKAILDGLWGKDKTKKDLLLLGSALKRILGSKKLVLVAIDTMTSYRPPQEDNNKNVTFIRTYLAEE